MYSPKIAEDLMPVLYKIGKAGGKPMTEIVNEIIREAIAKDTLRRNKETTAKNSRNKGKRKRE